MTTPSKNIIKLLVALLKYQAKRLFGEETLGILIEGMTEIAGESATQNLEQYFSEDQNAQNLISAFEEADNCFRKECQDYYLQQAIRSKPFRKLNSLEKLARRLPETLDDDGLLRTLHQQFEADWPGKFSDAQLDLAAKTYRICLERHLAVKCGEIFPILFIKTERIEKLSESIRKTLDKLSNEQDQQHEQVLQILNDLLNQIQKSAKEEIEPLPMRTHPSKEALLKCLERHFVNRELKKLCFLQGLKWENLSGKTQIEKTISIIEEADAKRRLSKLFTDMQEIYPELDCQEYENE